MSGLVIQVIRAVLGNLEVKTSLKSGALKIPLHKIKIPQNRVENPAEILGELKCTVYYKHETRQGLDDLIQLYNRKTF